MTGNEYQGYAVLTANRGSANPLANWGLGLAGEAGEVVEIVKKVAFHGHTLDQTKLRSELGDVLWYVAVLAAEVGLTLDDVMGANVAKLAGRYPEGFSEQASRERKT